MAKVLDSTPAELGYSMPAEWYPHSATWFSWPRPEGASFPDRYESIPENLAQIIKRVVEHEMVRITVPNSNYQAIVERQLRACRCPLDQIVFHYIRTDESWCRDHGPAFLLRRGRNGRVSAAIVDWEFNAWGGKYDRYADDDVVPTRIAHELKVPVFYPNMILEGGSVDFNGAGTVLTTESCLLNPNRNPDLTRRQIDRRLKNYYGQKHVVWLRGGIEGDDTDGHVDTVARFITPSKVVAAVENDTKDANYESTQENLARLHQARDQDGEPFDVIELPLPRPLIRDGERLPATYANFYFINGALLVPTYRDRKNDPKALEILQSHLPDRKVIGIDCYELIWGLGAIHCLTQQQPRW